MSHKPRYEKGNWLLIDDQSGFIVRKKRSRMQWNGLIVDEKDWEPEQPQNYLRAIPDNMTVPDPRPEGADVFITGYLIQENSNLIRLESGSGFLVLES